MEAIPKTQLGVVMFNKVGDAVKNITKIFSSNNGKESKTLICPRCGTHYTNMHVCPKCAKEKGEADASKG